MDTILNWGISLILAFQSLGDWLIGPMKFFTFLGYENFFMVIAPILYWCVDTAVGLRLGLLLMLSSSLNGILKLSFTQPRPYWVDARVVAHSLESSFGLPSGHAQNAVAVWGALAAWQRRTWAWTAALLLAFLIGISRWYLGVHFPTDGILGWAVGAALLWAFLRLEPRFLGWFRQFKPYQQTLMALGASFGILACGALARLALAAWEFPGSWQTTLVLTAPNEGLPEPLALAGIVSNTGVLFGLAAGAIGLRLRGGFQPRGSLAQILVRYLIGLAGVLLIWRGLGMVLPGDETLVGYLFRYLRYLLVGLWVSGLAPYLFIKAKLAEPLVNR